MTQEHKELLFKDLCGRQMYNVKCQVFNDAKPYTLSGVLHNKPYSQLYFEELDWKEFDGFVGVEYCKPYLFPLSSMTEEQKNAAPFESSLLNAFINGYISLFEDEELTIDDLNRLYDWFNRNHFDYRGLIPMGLANDATGLNIY